MRTSCLKHVLRRLALAGLPAVLAGCILAGCSQAPAATSSATATLAPTHPPPTPTTESTPTPAPTFPPFEPPLPSANTFGWDFPEGSKITLGLGEIRVIAFTPDSLHMAVQTGMGILVLDTLTFQEVWSAPIWAASASWSHDGSKIEFTNNTTVQVRDAATGALINRLEYDYVYPPDHAFCRCFGQPNWSYDDKYLVIPARDMIIWDYTTTHVVIPPDGSPLLEPRHEGLPHLWDNQEDGAKICPISESRAPSTWLPDGKRFIAAGPGDHEMSLWDTSCRQIGSIPRYSQYYPLVRFLNGGEQILLDDWDGDPDDGIVLWDIQARRVAHQLIGSGTYQVGWTSDSTHVVTVIESFDGSRREVFWDLDTGQAVPPINTKVIYPVAQDLRTHDGIVRSPEGEELGFRWGTDKTLEMFDTATGQTVRRLSAQIDYEGHSSTIKWSPDGRLAVVRVQSVSGKTDISNFFIFDASTWQLQSVYRDRVSFAFSPDNRWVAVADSAGQVVVWPAP